MESTPHLKEKFLSTNCPWDFEGGLGTIEPHWVYPKNIFANKSTGCGTIYWWKNYIPSNVSNQKNSDTFTLKTFWHRQFCVYEFFWFFVKKIFLGYFFFILEIHVTRFCLDQVLDSGRSASSKKRRCTPKMAI